MIFWTMLMLLAATGPNTKSSTSVSDDWKIEGRVHASGLYLQDDFDSQSVLEVYSGPVGCADPGTLEQVIFGPEKEQVAALCESQCCRERVLRGDEVVAERIISNEDEDDALITDEYDSGPALLASTGIDFQATGGSSTLKTKGNFTSSLLNDRTLIGHRKYRYQFTEAYYQYQKPGSRYRFRLGRQNPVAGALTDGLSATYFLGDAAFLESQSVSVFGGLAPNPISKHFELDRYTAGVYGTYIPKFSGVSDTKLRYDAGYVAELYKKTKWNRSYLFQKVHFTPVKEISLLGFATVDLPASGDNKEIGLNYSGLQTFWRPDNRWFLSGGFTQFRVDRFLQEESVRWLTDEGSRQADRVGDTLDRSHRYRFDLRSSFKAFPFLQPHMRLRYERRTFDGNKRVLNLPPGSTATPAENLSLLNKKNAYRLQPGFRLFPWRSLETETTFTFNQRFQSKAYEVYQSAQYDLHKKWLFDVFGQIVWSKRSIRNSVAATAPSSMSTQDYYAGLGISYKFMSDFLGQIRYDFSCEEDDSLQSDILTHSIWARLDYKF